MNYSNSMLSGVRAHRVGAVEPKTQMRMLAHTRLTAAISNQFYWTALRQDSHQEPKSLVPGPFAGLYSNPRVRQAFQCKFPGRIRGSPNWFSIPEICRHLCGAREMRVRFCRSIPSTVSIGRIVRSGVGLLVHLGQYVSYEKRYQKANNNAS
jgi:hypothetical protein